jgi:hypothetical protein
MTRWQRLLTIGRWLMVSLSVFFVFALPDRISPTGPVPGWAQAVLLLAPAAVFAWFWARVVGTRDLVRPAVATIAYVGLSVPAFAVVPHPPAASCARWAPPVAAWRRCSGPRASASGWSRG